MLKSIHDRRFIEANKCNYYSKWVLKTYHFPLGSITLGKKHNSNPKGILGVHFAQNLPKATPQSNLLVSQITGFLESVEPYDTLLNKGGWFDLSGKQYPFDIEESDLIRKATVKELGGKVDLKGKDPKTLFLHVAGGILNFVALFQTRVHGYFLELPHHSSRFTTNPKIIVGPKSNPEGTNSVDSFSKTLVTFTSKWFTKISNQGPLSTKFLVEQYAYEKFLELLTNEEQSMIISQPQQASNS